MQGDGFQVFVPDIHSAIYSEKYRTAQIEIEGGMSGGVVEWDVYSETLTGWNVGNDLQPMTIGDKDVILQRVSDALHVLDMPHRIV